MWPESQTNFFDMPFSTILKNLWVVIKKPSFNIEKKDKNFLL